MSLLELKNITKEFPGVKALDGVSFDLQKGEIHALCGENGAGKSTLIKILCGYHPAGSYGGEVRLDGQIVHFKDLGGSEEKGIALIAQELALVPEMSVAENLLLGRWPERGGFIQWDAVLREARRALDLVGLSIDPMLPVRELGIGQQQMIEIAKALSKKARILVLDEPTAALTESDAKRLLEFLKQLRRQGVSSIYISHRLEEVGRIADRVTVLRDGRSITTQPMAKLSQMTIISHMVGRKVKNLYPRPKTRAGKTLLGVKDFSVEDPANPGRYVVCDVSFDVKAGEVLGIAGLMGSGRTALLSSLFGAARGRTQGSLWVEGKSHPLFHSPQKAIEAGVALVSEDRKRFGLVLESTVEENLILATMRRLVRHGFLDHSRILAECGTQVAAMRIKTPSLSVWVNKLSGGNQQKVVLGKWLMTKPRVLFLDEPTRGIDVGAKAEIYELMGQLAGQGIGIVLVSSDLPEILGLSHRVLVLNQGRMAAELKAGQATPERVLAAAALKGHKNKKGVSG
ncbi:MAG TPA: ATP-binding cassette domain-containing protein [bacterium]|nr:ATP-binding cassette domain-containing protein [bacterium]